MSSLTAPTLPPINPAARLNSRWMGITGRVRALRFNLDFVPQTARETAKVYIIDRIVTRPGRAREFVDRYLAEYAPGAADRGMTLERILVSPPIWFADDSNTVTACWAVNGAQGWWEMTWKGRPDRNIGQWWAVIDELIESRTRTMASEAGDVDPLCDV